MKLKFKTKRCQSSVFGMSFSTIVSIILIVVFVGAAFMAIKAFLDYQKCATIGMFLDDLQNGPKGITTAWYAESASYNFTANLPGGIEYVCFINLTAPVKNANDQEKGIYQIIQDGAISNYANNLYIYAPNKDYCIKWKTLSHVDLSWKNPICVKVFDNKVRLRITRDYSSALVKVSE